jgi:hypothetical protein
MVSHGSLAVAVQAHVGPDAVTATVPAPPSTDTRCSLGEIEKVQAAGGAACVTVNVCPPIVKVPVRTAPVLAAALNPTVPFPVPDAPLVSVSQPAFAVAVQVHVDAEAVTVTEPEPPVSPTD